MFWAVYFNEASTNHGADISYMPVFAGNALL